MATTLGERMKKARQMVDGFSTRELGRLAGTAESYPSLIESGLRPHVGSEALIGFARVLGVSLDWLMKGEGEEPLPHIVQASVAKARRDAPPDSERRATTPPVDEGAA